MIPDDLLKLIRNGETLTVEFKGEENRALPD
jgi:hypothetical protein